MKRLIWGWWEWAVKQIEASWTTKCAQKRKWPLKSGSTRQSVVMMVLMMWRLRGISTWRTIHGLQQHRVYWSGVSHLVGVMWIVIMMMLSSQLLGWRWRWSRSFNFRVFMFWCDRAASDGWWWTCLIWRRRRCNIASLVRVFWWTTSTSTSFTFAANNSQIQRLFCSCRWDRWLLKKT